MRSPVTARVRRNRILRALLPIALAAAAIPAHPAAAADGREFTGVRGRAVLGDAAAGGVVVCAFRDFDRGLESEIAARSEPTAPDGTFSLELSPGRYFLVAARTAGDNPADPAPGDLFGYLGVNPVRVETGRAVRVAFTLAKLGKDPAADNAAGLSGVVYGPDGAPLAGATVSLYGSAGGGFRGMPGTFARTKADGTFAFRVRKGTFYVVVRKRASGDLLGPTRPGDHFGYYPRNPVVLADGERRGIRIDALPRKVLEGEPGGDRGVRVRTVDPEGHPLAGIRILAYTSKERTGSPAFVSGTSGKDGMVSLILPDGETYYLVARERLGGPPDGEWYGKYEGSPDRPVRGPRAADAAPLTIVLERR